jgi:hypothetical protein
MAIKRKDLRNEADHLPGSVGDLIALRRRLIEVGASPAKANGLIGWLIAKKAGEPDTTGNSVRSEYRKLLAQLGEPEPIGTPPRPARKRPAQGGGSSNPPIILVQSVMSGRRRQRQRVLAARAQIERLARAS